MKTLTLLAAALLTTLSYPSGVAQATVAGEQPLNLVKPQDRNAALKYWEAASAISSDLAARVGDIDYPEVGTTGESARKCEKFQAALKLADGWDANQWIAASRLARCDFEIRYEDGFLALLPHLGKMRSGARLVRFEARRLLVDGKPDDAAECIAAMVRMGNHVAADGFLISSLVGHAITTLGVSEANVLAESGRMTEHGREVIRTALDAIDDKDPLRMRAAIVNEQTVMLDWVRRNCTGPDAGAKLAGFIIPNGVEADEMTLVHRKIIEQLDEQALARELEQTRRAYVDMLAAWDSEDPVKACEDVSARMKREEFGPVAAELCPAVSRARSVAQRLDNELKECREKLAAATIAEPPTQDP